MQSPTKADIRLKDRLEGLYAAYNQRAFVDPDPLMFLYPYTDKKEREIVGLLAACLAYGRVEMILKTIARVLEILSPSPSAYILGRTRPDMIRDFRGFRYRFASETHVVDLLWGIRQVLNEFSSLEACFYHRWSPDDPTVMNGLKGLFQNLCRGRAVGHLLPDPGKKSACKRSHLFLRWMVRNDGVDPGGWEQVRPSQLIVPLDTHMHRAGHLLGFTRRKAMDLKTALEITRGFRRISGDDPVKYDFCLTRFGIRRDMDREELRRQVCGQAAES